MTKPITHQEFDVFSATRLALSSIVESCKKIEDHQSAIRSIHDNMLCLINEAYECSKKFNEDHSFESSYDMSGIEIAVSQISSLPELCSSDGIDDGSISKLREFAASCIDLLNEGMERYKESYDED